MYNSTTIEQMKHIKQGDTERDQSLQRKVAKKVLKQSRTKLRSAKRVITLQSF